MSTEHRLRVVGSSVCGIERMEPTWYLANADINELGRKHESRLTVLQPKS